MKNSRRSRAFPSVGLVEGGNVSGADQIKMRSIPRAGLDNPPLANASIQVFLI